MLVTFTPDKKGELTVKMTKPAIKKLQAPLEVLIVLVQVAGPWKRTAALALFELDALLEQLGTPHELPQAAKEAVEGERRDEAIDEVFHKQTAAV